MSRWLAPVRVNDAALAALLCLLDLVVSWDPGVTGMFSGPVTTPLYAVAGFAALTWRRSHPRAVFAIMTVHSALAFFVVPGFLPTLGLWVALGTVAATSTARVTLVAVAAGLVPIGLNVVDQMRSVAPDRRLGALVTATVIGVLFTLVAAGIGRWVLWSRQQRLAAAERAAAEAIAAERVRIARDLHDVVAHAVSLMVLQAAGAAAVLERDPDRARTALRHVSEQGRQAVVELRRMLSVLQPVDDAAGSASEAHAPPGLADLAALCDTFRAGGLTVVSSEEGVVRPVAPSIGLAAYRTVQEALTNAARYADHDRPVTVELCWGVAELVVRVSDQGPPPGRAPHATRGLSTGRGLIGMRERVRSVGGRLDAGTSDTDALAREGRTPAAGFVVTAVLPIATSMIDLRSDAMPTSNSTAL